MCRKLICSICVVVVLGLVGSASAFQVVDDFEGGNLNIWEITEGQAAVAIGPDPTNPSNNCLVFSPETITMRTPWGLPEGEAEMLSYRLMYDKQADGTVTLIFGASDPDGTAWGNYYALARMNSYGDPANIPDMDVRDGGAYTDVVQADLEPLRWYDVLLDIDTASKKYDVYIDGVLVFQGAAFRSGYSPANLEYIILKTTTWENNFANGTVYVDDIVLGEPAVTITVEAGGDIAAANAIAKAGDTIEIAAGTYYLTSQIEIKDGVTYRGAGSGLTIIDGNDTTRAFVAWGDRSFNEGNENPNDSGPKGWVLEGMTIQNCVADTNNRFSYAGAAFDMLDVFADNDADASGGLNPEEADADAGAIRLPGEDGAEGTEDDDLHRFAAMDADGNGELSEAELNAQLLSTDDEFGDENGDGGAITIHNEAVGTIQNCDFLNNHTPIAGDGDDGGAINITGRSVVTINDCLFNGNYACSPTGVPESDETGDADGDGSHIKVQGGSASAITPGTTLIANRCVFLNGRAEDDGGAIQSSAVGSIIRLDACWFEGNTAADDGTVLFIGNESSHELTVTNCVFANNISTADSDRMCQVRRNSNFINCTFVGNNQGDQDLIYNNANAADTDNDGVDDEMADATQVINCIFANNVVGNGDDVLGSRNDDFTIAATNCLFFGNTLQNGNAADNTQRPDVETGSVLTDPLLDANYVPGAGSDAIDGGVDPATVGVTLTADYNGNARPHGAAYDIGAYEVGATSPVTEGLAAYYALENDVLDGSGNGNDGTIVGAPTFVDGPAGYGMAMEFDGESYVDCGNDASLDITGPISMGIWIRPGTDGNVETAPLCKADASAGWSWQLRYGWGSGGKPTIMGFQFNATGGSVWIFVNQDLAIGEWYHIAASHDGATVKCYLDGVETDSAPMTDFAGGPSSLLIGSDGWRSDWIGAIDDVRIYDRALSEGEVLYLAGYRAPVNLVQNGTFDVDSAWTVIEHTVPAVTNIDLTYADDAPAKGEAPCLRVSADGVAVSRPLIYQKLTLTAGATYQVTAAIKIINFYGPASYPPGPWFQIYMNDAEPDPPADATFDWNPSTKLLNIMPWNDCFIGNSYEEVIGADGLMEELSGCSDIGDNTGLYIPPGDRGTEVDIWLVIKPGMWASSDVAGGYDVLFDNVGVYPVKVVDDFESYNDLDPDDPESNRIFNVWLDGLDNPTNGSLVGYDNPPFTEQTIVHGGNQSMPLYYDNSVGYSEATLILTYPRDWTENGVTMLTIWFRGDSANAAETLYVALNGSAVVNHDNPDAAQITTWTQWNIDLQAFAKQGVDLTNVNSISLGLGNKNNPLAGGSGTMYFDDIRLCQPATEPEPAP